MTADPEKIKRFNEWQKHRIWTPTFRLSPVEKPDMSPFLVHMTGKGSLAKILKGEGSPAQRNGYGFLKSAVPETGGSGAFDAAVVCFTESPVFALDFFRFRSDKRWMEDQQYGIGFSKERLILDHGVRPVVCLDSQTNSELLALCNRAEAGSQRLAEDETIHRITKSLLAKLKPLLFPMLETTSLQGFMWEREWRYPSPAGWQFPHSAIKLICCPKEEQAEVLSALGPLKPGVQVIESWKEYNELTAFLKERATALAAFNLDSIYQIEDVGQLLKLQADCGSLLNSLHSYRENLKALTPQFSDPKLDAQIDHLWEYYQRIDEQLTGCRYYQSVQFEEAYQAWELSQRYEQ